MRRLALGGREGGVDRQACSRILRNLALALNEAGRFDEALAVCGRLEEECRDEITADATRSLVYLNVGEWTKAADAARRSGGDIVPSSGFVEAFALRELGLLADALPAFVRAALNHPRAARMLVGERTAEPRSYEEATDHNTGVSLLRGLHAYLKGQSRPARQFFRGLVRDPRVAKLLDESIAVVRRWHDQHPTGEREAFDRMQLMRSREFARAEASKLGDLIPGAAPAPTSGPRSSRRRAR